MMRAVTVLTLIVSWAVASQAQVPIYQQCGGIGWSGATNCVSGTVCTKLNDYYFQCLPGSGGVTTTTTRTTTTTTTTRAATTTTTAPPASGTLLSRTNNPAANWFNKAKTAWSTSLADKVLTYQLTNGGWPKNNDYNSVGNGSGGSDSGTIDNGATCTELVYLAQTYKTGGNTKYRDAARKAFNYILSAQYSKGGWPQYFPLKGGYPDYVTYNDDAMVHALTVLDAAVKKLAPFDNDIFTDSDRSRAQAAITKGVDYILKSQWKQNGVLTGWCQQTGPDDYQPKPARAYELVSISGKEGVQIVAFLMLQPQTAAVQTAVRAALAWYRSPNTYLNNYTYDSSQNNPIVPKSGSKMWYRFYDLNTNRGFFSDRDGGKYYDIMQISEERRTGYQWGGNYGNDIDSYAKSVGY